jgi:hypothetical protein
MDPDYPLANLTPITTARGLVVEPGVQGLDLPAEDLEDLFRKCREGRFDQAEIMKFMPGLFKRR